MERKGRKTVRAEEYERKFLEAVNDDLNMPKALTIVWKLVRDEKEVSDGGKYDLLQEFDKILAIDLSREVTREKLPETIEELIRRRESARKKRDWETADKLREEIKKLGYLLEDTPEGIRWRKISG